MSGGDSTGVDLSEGGWRGGGGLLSRGELFNSYCSVVVVFGEIIQGYLSRVEKSGGDCLDANFIEGNCPGASCPGRII